MTKQLIPTGAEHLPDLYAKATSKIKILNLKRLFNQQLQKKIVNKLHQKGVKVGRQRRIPARAKIPAKTEQNNGVK